MLYYNLVNQKFNYLRVLHFAGRKKNVYKWLCLCDCGKTVIVRSGNLKNGHTKSCGCYNVKRAIETNTVHNMCFTRFYRTWAGMLSRCKNKNDKRYTDWGGRGIKVEWKTFLAFKNDMYKSYLKHLEQHGNINTTIDRINNDGNYHKLNCRWATRKEQANNKRPYRKNIKAAIPDKKETNIKPTIP